MKRMMITVAVAFALLTSCKTSMPNITPIEQKIKSIELGMNRERVMNIMGSNYQLVGKSLNPDGMIETLGYYDYTNGMYKLNMQNGKLISWEYSPGIKYNYSRHPE